MKAHTHNRLSELFANIIYTAKKWFLVFALLLFFLLVAWTAWTEWGWGQEPKTIVFIAVATEQEQRIFFRTHPNCWPIDRMGDIVKIECEVLK